MQRPANLHFSVNDWIADIRCAGGIAPIAEQIRRRGLAKSRIGIVGYSSAIQVVPTIFHGEMEALKRELPEAQFVEFGWAFEEMRLIKSEEEIGMLRRAAQLSRKVIDAMVAHSRPGVTEAKVYAEMIKTQIENGCEPTVFNLFAAGPVEHPPAELWHLLHGAEPPPIPTVRPLRKGDLVIAEWHRKYGGDLAHTEYCVYVGGKAPQRLKDIFAVSVECLEASRPALRAGNTLRAAWEAVRKPAEKAKLDFVELGFHAMGLGSPEFPTVIYRPGYGTNALNGHNIADVVLEEDMCFGNNIDRHDPAWKPDVGCMLSDFMVVRPGAECLVGTPRELAETE
jgi:Xaa-Pro aminopeptidase